MVKTLPFALNRNICTTGIDLSKAQFWTRIDLDYELERETNYHSSNPAATDLLFGSNRERLALEAGHNWQDIAAMWQKEEAAFLELRKPPLIYPL